MEQLQKYVKEFLNLKETVFKEKKYAYIKIFSTLYNLSVSLLEAEREKIEEEKIQSIINPVKEILTNSPFFKRIQIWPKGYQGDYETIEYLYDAVNRAEKDSFAYYCEEYALQSQVAQQHRNKIQFQAQLILDTVLNGKMAPKILVIGCGGCKDIYSVKNYIKKRNFHLYLNDNDKDALNFAKVQLTGINKKCKYIEGPVIAKLKEFENYGPFDLIISGGLFDYIKNKVLKFLIKYLFYRLLNTKGVFFFTNIAESNPYQICMKYLASWALIERSENDIIKLLTGIGIDEKTINITRDKTGLSLLVRITK